MRLPLRVALAIDAVLAPLGLILWFEIVGDPMSDRPLRVVGARIGWRPHIRIPRN